MVQDVLLLKSSNNSTSKLFRDDMAPVIQKGVKRVWFIQVRLDDIKNWD
jgi:hypothetical protein